MTLLRTSIAVIAGIVLAAYLHPAWMLAAAGGGCALFLLAPQSKRRALFAYTCAMILAGLYCCVYQQLHHSLLEPHAVQGKTVVMRGTIDSPVRRDGDVARFFFAVHVFSHPGGQWESAGGERIALRVSLGSEEQAKQVDRWVQGMDLEAAVQLSLPAVARNPNAFDYERYLHWLGVQVTGETSFADIRIVRHATGIWGWFQQWQGNAAARIDSLFADQEAAGYMKSLLLGLQHEASPDLSDMYAKLGLSHILAISGLHVTLVSSMFLWLLERSGINRKWALLVTVLLLIGYVLLVGASASAVRSGLMGGVGLVCQAFRRHLDGREVWAGALLAMLAVNPFFLWQIGFQLSFAVTLGLIVFVPYCLQVGQRLPAWLRASIAVTFVAQVVSFPFLVYHFHLFSPLSWLVNLVATPLLSAIVLPMGYTGLLLGLIHPALSTWPVLIATQLLHWLHKPLFALQEMNVPFTHWPHPDWWWLILYALFLSFLPWLWERGYHRKRDMLGYALLFFVLLVLARQPFSGDGVVRITFLDVGQGDSIVVEVGTKKVYLMDAGGNPAWPSREAWREKRDPFDPGKNIVLPFLRSRGIDHIDTVVMTHGDLDHIGGMKALLPHFSFGQVFVNGRLAQAAEREIVQRFWQRSIPVLTGKSGDRWTDLPGVEWEWLYPDGQRSEGSENDASVVLKLTAYGTTVLFTGDIEKDGEEQLLMRGLSNADIVKVAHHGSKTSSTDSFLAATQPAFAVISAGQNNRYGHPAPDVIERLEQFGSSIYRTDRDGAITLVISSEGYTWTTELSDT
ncbi:DNA internalization-related competence protein ComEC/Rec2 [Brevibacillus sp. TJ4]|uniref:DNA internalization-related competence protein ComEC/Rec2 n=1 Tax=Brevibacillus sp. TJ4 TaxID=3234853 RepID=UPI0037D4D4AA